jgi:hypothetical protein
VARREGPVPYFRQSSGEMAASKYAQSGLDHNGQGLVLGPLALSRVPSGMGAKSRLLLIATRHTGRVGRTRC